MSDWTIQRGDRVRSISEEQLRHRLRRGKLLGVELVRPPGESRWVRLAELPIFAEEVPAGADPVGEARSRAKMALISSWGAFAAIMLYFTLSSGEPPIWGIFWGMAVLGQTARTVRLLRRTPASLPAPAAQPAPPVEAEPLPDSPFLQQIRAALAALREATPPERAADLDALAAAAVALDRDHAALLSLASQPLLGGLEAELAELKASVASAPDARSAEDFQRAADAVGERLEATRAAGVAATRLDARRRALLHQIEGLRLGALHARVDEAGAPDLSGQLQAMRAGAEARGEVEETLARARRAARAGVRG